MAISFVVLWTLLLAWWWLKRRGLPAWVDRATDPERARRSRRTRERGGCLRYEDAAVCWWLTRLRSRSVCLYRAMVMMERLARLDHVGTIELVLGVRRTPGGPLFGHAYLLVNGDLYREDPEVLTSLVVTCRFRRMVREVPAEPPVDALAPGAVGGHSDGGGP